MSEQHTEATQPPVTIDAPAVTAPAEDLSAGVRRLQCDMVITKHVSVALGAGFIPLPVFDFAAVTAVQMRMVYQLCRIYEVPFSKEAARTIVTTLIGASVPALPAGALSSGLKMIPGVGTALGMFAAPSLYAATTYAVGRVFVEHLESGGTLLTFDAQKMKSHFEKALQRGQEAAAAEAKS